MKIKIKTYNGELNDLTLGKNYEVSNDFGDGYLGITDDDGFWFITRLDEPCSFLNDGTWELQVSEFDKWWEENCMTLSSDRTEAEDIYNLGVESQQAKIDELQAIVYGLKRDQNNLELKAEDAECVSMSLDDQGVEKCDDDGKTYSLWGRVCQFKKTSNVTENDLERVYWEFDQERNNSGGERVVFKNTLRSLLNNLKGNKDEN